MTHVIIVAGGTGTRMASTLPKQFLPLGDKPVLFHTIEAFRRYDALINIVLVLHPEMITYWQALCTEHAFDTPLNIVEGGATRFHSVQHGVEALKEASADDLVLVHDAVRPFVSPELIKGVLDGTEHSGASIPTVPISDSLRLLQGDVSLAVDRSHYCAVQTPQGFRLGILREAYEQPYAEHFTDDASVVEHRKNAIITLTQGDLLNFKLTTPIDFALARTLLES